MAELLAVCGCDYSRGRETTRRVMVRWSWEEVSCYFDSGHGSRFQCAVRGVGPEVFVSREPGCGLIQ
jgi:hypothetical protein